MKTNRIVLTLSGLLLAASANLHAAHCSNASIAGKWAETNDGTVFLPQVGPVQVAAVGNFSIDAVGNIEGKQTRSLAGQVAEETLTGAVSINPDCTGEATVYVYQNGTLTRTTTLHVVFDDNSRSARAIFESIVLPDGTSLPSVITFDARRLFPKDEERDER